MESSLSPNIKNFEQNYQTHLKRLKLNGMQPKTIEAYSFAVRRAGGYFGYQIDALTVQQLTDYFADLLESHSWSTVKHDLYGLKYYYEHVLQKAWASTRTGQTAQRATAAGHRHR